MRIGMFTDQYYPYISGVVTSIMMLSQGLEALGHQCYIFTSYDEKKLTEEQKKVLEEQGNVINLPGRCYPMEGLKDYRYKIFKKPLVKIVAKYNLDIIHVHSDYNISKVATLCRKKLHIPVVHTFHTLWEGYIKYFSPFLDNHFHHFSMKVLKNLFIAPASKNCDAEVFPTNKLIVNEKIYGFGQSKNIFIIPTGIDLTRFSTHKMLKKERLEFREKLGLHEDDFVYLYLGRTSREKQIDVIIDAFDNACYDIPNARLLIVGGGPEYDELVEQAKTKRSKDKIIFTGLINMADVPSYYQIGDIFVNASQSETQGLTYIEALASALPVLVQSDPCFDGVIENYYNGIIFDGIDDLSKNMKEILKAPETLKAIKKNTASTTKKYSKEEYANSILAIYTDLLDKKNRN